MTLYQRYARLPIRFTELGLERGSEKSSYFCTPKGARVIGWAGVDGIHFCFVPGYGDAVFAVNPMAAGDYVQVVARNFEDFLRLILACGSSAAIEQVRQWTREQFDAFVAADDRDYPPRRDALQAIAGLGVAPMDDPFGYLETLRGEFDVSKLQPRELPAEAESSRVPFPVVWDSSIHGRPRRRHPAREVAVNAEFSWGAEAWRVPKLYVCAEGIVLDYCVGVDVEKVTEFLRYYEEVTRGDWGVELSQEQQEEVERRNPLQIAFHSALIVDGKKLPAKGGSSTVWVPESCGNEELTQDNRRTRAIVEHYGLDVDKAWVFWRCRYPWKTRRGSGVKTASLHLTRDKEPVTRTHFTDPAAGEELRLTHPVTGAVHLLRVEGTESQTMDAAWLQDTDTEYPPHFVVLHGTVTPPLEGLTLRDCNSGDQPRSKNGVFAIQIFGRSKGDRAAAGSENVTGFSASYFTPPQSVTWRAVANEKTMEDVEIKLI